MMNIRDNRGMTLVELMVAIAIGALITTAVTAVMLVGLRVFHESNAIGVRQNEVRMAITFMEDLLAESAVAGIEEETAAEPYQIVGKAADGTDQILLSYQDESVCTGAGTVLLDDVQAFVATLDGNLLIVTMTIAEETYSFAVFCPLAEVPSETSSMAYGYRDFSPQTVMTQAMDDKALTFYVRAFLKTLGSQVGSTGRIQTENGEGDYYSAWYIGGYEDNPGWDADTPWCGCFISWALEENRGYLRGRTPKFANVDTFWTELVEVSRWKTEAPEAGDIIFFDWILDEEQNPQHVGVVIGVMDGWVYTIEGNSNGKVALCQYALEDPHIMGYGVLNWI